MSKSGKIIAGVTPEVVGMDTAGLPRHKAAAASKTKFNGNIQPRGDEASDRASIKQMKLESIAKFASQFGKNAKVEDATFLE